MAGKIRHFKERNGRYSARLVVPKNLREIVGKAELEIQLGPDRRQALARLPGAVAGLQAKIAVAERHANGGRPVAARYPMTAEEIAVANYNTLIAFDLEIREHDPRFANAGFDDLRVAGLRAGMAGRLNDDALEDLIGYQIENFRHRGNTDAAKGSTDWRRLAINLCVSEYEALARKVERDEGDFAGRPAHPLIANAQSTDAPHEPVLLPKLLDAYLKNLERQGKGREARKRWTPVFDDLARFVKHKDAARLTKKNLIEWRDKKLETLAAKTVADVHLASVRAVLAWAVENERLASNPADGVRLRKSKPIRSREKGFRDDEAIEVLKACRAYLPAEAANPSNRESVKITRAKKWASLLCAFTGARVTEITQLRKVDVRKEGDGHVIRITPDAGSVKTAHYRDVPIHQQLVDLGFIDFVQASLDGPLFHNGQGDDDALKSARTSSGRVSNWLQSLGVIPEGVQPNHGWRHRFKTVGEELGVSSRVLDAIQGHAGKTAGDGYGDVTITAKRKVIAQFPRYDLETKVNE
jgi:integrase